MLKHQLIHPKISEVLARAGHHSVILIADNNYAGSWVTGRSNYNSGATNIVQ